MGTPIDYVFSKPSFNEQMRLMSGWASLPINIWPFTLFGITGSFMMLETGFVNKNMLIGYARVSTMDQNPALQMDALRDIGCGRIFVEKASGSHRDRPQLKAALDYLREGDTLAVWKLSRLARSLSQVIKTASDIAERGIALKVLTQNIDTSTPEGRLFFHMTAAFDEFQRELIVENTRAGLKAAAKRGRRGGRPKAMNEQNIKHAEAMLKDTENYPFIGDVIDQLKIGRTAFYKYFPTDRIKQLRPEHSGTPQT